MNGNWHSAPLTAPLVVMHVEELDVVVAVAVVVSTTIPMVVVVDSVVVVVVVVGAAVVVGGLLQVCATADSLALLQSSPEQHLPTRF